PFSHDAANGNSSAVGIDDRFGHGQSNAAHADAIVAFEWFEKHGKYFGQNSAAGIGNSHSDLVFDEIGCEGKRTAAPHRLDRIFNHDAKRARKPAQIDVDVALVANVFDELNLFAGQKMERLAVQLVKQSPDRHRALVH